MKLFRVAQVRRPNARLSGMETALETLANEIERCRICLDSPTGAPLPHDARPVLRVSTTARICICGQAPGTRVHESGIPFTDPSGDRLRDWMGVTEDEFYDVSRVAIVPMGFCFPGLDAKGGDLPPRKECAPAWRDKLFDLMPQIELFLLVGKYAQDWHLGRDAASTLTETVKQWNMCEANAKSPVRIPLPHPSWRNNAWIKRNTWFEERILPALKHEVAARM